MYQGRIQPFDDRSITHVICPRCAKTLYGHDVNKTAMEKKEEIDAAGAGKQQPKRRSNEVR